jgi:two-component system cell cycle sensor histidine kinase/response regulator CckA
MDLNAEIKFAGSPVIAEPLARTRDASLRNVLLVEDSRVDARLVIGMLSAQGEGLQCTHVEKLADAIETLQNKHQDVVLLDLNLPDSSGYDTFFNIFRAVPKAAVLVLSSSEDEELAVRTVREGAQDYLVKGSFDARLLLRSIRYAFERRRAEEAVRQSDATVRAVFESSLDGILISSENDICEEANSAAATLFGLSRVRLIGRNIHSFTPPDFEEAWKRFRESGNDHSQFWVQRGDGSRRLVECFFSAQVLPGRNLCILRDITEQESLEEQLRQSQKMEAVGRLAGGVAHDFNNILGIISGYAELIQINCKDESVVSRTGKILIATEKASALTRQLLAFGRKQLMSPRLLDLSTVLTGISSMLQCLLGAEIQLIVHVGEHLGHVRADQSQLEQVLLNLATNARDAMPQGGMLTIHVENCAMEATPELPAGEYVRLSVTDTGMGMDAEIQSRIFEPFFTTKKDHSGLGLATVYGTVKQSGGYVTLNSASSQGTTFNVYLPMVAVPKTDSAVPGAITTPVSGQETILLVDDEDALREAASEYLESCGYKVLKAANGKDAIDILEAYQGRIDAVISDVIMPKVNGRALMDHVRRVRPDSAMLVISGYADDAVVRNGIFLETASFMQKPFTLQALSSKIRELIARK